MKTARLQDIFLNIIKKRIPFLSILGIMFVGLSGIPGLFYLGVSVDRCVTDYYKEHNFKDFEIISTMGVKAADIDRIMEVEGIDDAEAAYVTQALLVYGDTHYDLDILSVTERISVPYAVSGRLPERDNECAVSDDVMTELGLSEGDSIRIFIKDPNLDGLLKEEEFLVTGAAQHPDYISRLSNDFAVLAPSAFDGSVLDDAYTSAFVSMDSDKYDNFIDKKYKKATEEVEERLIDLASVLSDERTRAVTDEANAKYDDAKRDADEALREAYDKLTDAQNELDRELKKASEELESGEEELKQKLSQGQESLDAGQKSARSQMDTGLNRLREGEREYGDGLNELARGQQKFDEGMAKLETGKVQLEDAKQALDAGRETYNTFISEIDKVVDDVLDATDPFRNRIRQITDELDGIFQDLGFSYINKTRWDDFKSYLARLDDIRSSIRNSQGFDRLSGMADYLALLRTVYNDYTEYIYDVALELGIDNASDLKEVSDILTLAENRINDVKSRLSAAKEKLDNAEAQYKNAKQEYDNAVASADIEKARNDLINGQEQLDDARRQLDEGWSEYKRQVGEGEKKLQAARDEYSKARDEGTEQILSGWKTYYEERESNINKLSDGWEEYEKKEKEAEDKLSKARDEIDSIKRCFYLVKDRELNRAFSEVRPYHNAIFSLVFYFFPVFALIASTVCFSNIAIMIDEQKKQVGALKALGFYNKEIGIKYIVFSFLGTITGSVLGIFGGRGIEYIVQTSLKDVYVFGMLKNIIVWPVIIIISFVMLLTSAFVAHSACKGLLKCSASGLINGSEPVKRSMTRSIFSDKRSLYSSLIVSNILMDAERVLVSIAVIAGCTLLVGSGFSVQMALAEASELQYKIYDYDFKVVVSGADTEEIRNRIEETLESAGADFLPVTCEDHVYSNGNRYKGLPVICGNEEGLSDFLNLTDMKGRICKPQSYGLLVRHKFVENAGIEKGDSFILYDNFLEPKEAYVTGTYVNPVDELGIITSEAYLAQFGEVNVINSYLVRARNGSPDTLKQELTGLSDRVSIENQKHLHGRTRQFKVLGTLMAVVLVAVSVVLSAMILINLTNILVDRRMKELLIMLVNGFSLRQVIGYLVRETAMTTLIGLAVGVAVGIPFSLTMIRGFESGTSMYSRTPYPLAWVLSVVLNIIFTVVIDFVSFRKIGKQPLTNVSMQ